MQPDRGQEELEEREQRTVIDGLKQLANAIPAERIAFLYAQFARGKQDVIKAVYKRADLPEEFKADIRKAVKDFGPVLGIFWSLDH